jgi:hypothetical protein
MSGFATGLHRGTSDHRIVRACLGSVPVHVANFFPARAGNRRRRPPRSAAGAEYVTSIRLRALRVRANQPRRSGRKSFPSGRRSLPPDRCPARPLGQWFTSLVHEAPNLNCRNAAQNPGYPVRRGRSGARRPARGYQRRPQQQREQRPGPGGSAEATRGHHAAAGDGLQGAGRPCAACCSPRTVSASSAPRPPRPPSSRTSPPPCWRCGRSPNSCTPS